MPFKVHAGQMGVTVLGTEFHIKARGAEPEVALVSGKVRVGVLGEEENSMVLAHGEKAQLSGRNGKLVRSEAATRRSEEHTSEIQSLMRIAYAVFCLKTKKTPQVHSNAT